MTDRTYPRTPQASNAPMFAKLGAFFAVLVLAAAFAGGAKKHAAGIHTPEQASTKIARENYHRGVMDGMNDGKGLDSERGVSFGEPGFLPCTTDIDCETKNGGSF